MTKRQTVLVQHSLEGDRAKRDKFSGPHKTKWAETVTVTPAKYGKNPKRRPRAFDKVRTRGVVKDKQNEESTIADDGYKVVTTCRK
jgi:hypothetical protein